METAVTALLEVNEDDATTERMISEVTMETIKTEHNSDVSSAIETVANFISVFKAEPEAGDDERVDIWTSLLSLKPEEHLSDIFGLNELLIKDEVTSSVCETDPLQVSATGISEDVDVKEVNLVDADHANKPPQEVSPSVKTDVQGCHGNFKRNAVKYLQSTKFSRLSPADKTEVLRLGRATPELSISQQSSSRNQTYVRNFNNAVYTKHKWLTGCAGKNALFCFPCLLFGGDPIWTKNGVKDLKHLVQKIKKHEDSAKHLKNIIELAILGRAKTASRLREVCAQATNRCNEHVRRNRELVSKIIDCVKFCGEFQLPLCGRYETLHPGVFLGLLEFAGKLDVSLRTHFLTSSVFRGTFKTVQNELLGCVLEVCQDEIRREVKRASFLSVMLHDVTDISEHARHVILYRYELDGAVHVRFWGFFNPKPDGLAECVSEQLSIVLNGDSDKLVAQAYDVTTGGVQTIVKQSYQHAHLVHCYAHQLSSVVEKAAVQNSDARIFFSNLAAIPAFFAKSSSRLATLDSVSKRIPQRSNVEWNFNGQLISAVHEHKDILKNCCAELQFSRNQATVQGATQVLHTLNCEDFNFWLTFFHQIMPDVDVLHSHLQHHNTNARSIYKAVDAFLKVMTRQRDNLPSEVQEEEEDTSPPKRRKRISQNLASGREVCDNISCHVKERFAFTKHLSAATLFNPCFFQGNERFPSSDLKDTVEAYPFLNKERLVTELFVLYKRQELRGVSELMKIYDIMRSTGISEYCTEVLKLLQIIISTPVTSAEAGGCCSTLERVKTFMRSSASHLSVFAVLSVERVMVQQITNFNEKVIEKFAALEERKVDFMYKEL